MKKMIFMFLILFFSFNAYTENTKVPDWVTKKQDVWVEEGIIYSRGSAKSANIMMAQNMAVSRARTNIGSALANNEITGYSPIPADAKSRSSFKYNGISGKLGETKIEKMFAGDDGTVYVLLSCNGAEVESKN